MEFDQLIFKKIYDLYQGFSTKKNPEKEARAIKLEDIKPRLTLIARALTGEPINIYTSEREGGWKNDIFLLPAKYDKAATPEDNLKFYLFRTIYLAKQKELNINWEKSGEYSPAESRAKALDASVEILCQVFEEYPTTKTIYNNLLKAEEIDAALQNVPLDLSWLYGRWMYSPQKTDDLQLSHMPDEKEKKKLREDEKKKSLTEIKAKPSDEVKTVEVDRKKIEDYSLNHNFEKIETADEFDGVWRDLDGDDTLKDDEEALKELSLKVTVRVDDAAHSVYQAEFTSNPHIKETATINPSDVAYQYDEWDYAKRNYKKDYCTVFYNYLTNTAKQYTQEALAKNQVTLNHLTKLLNQINNEFETVKQRTDGEDIDFDAVADNYSEMIGRRTPSEKLYMTKAKRNKDISVLLLLDSSLSSDSYTKDKRVLDIEKESALVFGEAMERIGINFQIDTFSSRTHNHCTYKTIKSFDDKWHATKSRVSAIEPEGYTRIGPALRHAGALLEQTKTSKKWIVLFSDGKPNDFDKYEGRYGIEDIKKALNELNNRNIFTSSLAIEDQAKYYLPLMFGHRSYEILPDTSVLPFALAKFYKRIVSR